MTSKKGDHIARTKALSRAADVKRYLLTVSKDIDEHKRPKFEHIIGSINSVIDYLAD